MLRRRFKIASRDSVTYFGVMMLMLLWVGTYYSLERDEADDINRARINLANLVRHYEEHTVRVLGNADRVLRTIRERLEGGTESAALNEVSKLATSVSELTFQVAIIDGKGLLQYTTVSGLTKKPIDLSDREHFRVHVGSDRDDLFISKPVLGRATNKWAVQLTRKLIGKQGEFVGVVVLSLDPTELSKPFNDMDMGAHGLVVLAGTDGVVRAHNSRSPYLMGQAVTERTLGKVVLGGLKGDVVEFVGEDGVARLVSFTRVRGTPLIVAVGVSASEILADLNASRNWQLLAVVALTLAIAFAVGLSVARRSRLEVAKAQIYRSQRREQKKASALQATLDSMSQGIIMVGADRAINVINRQAIELLGLEDSYLNPGYQFDDLIDQLAKNGEFGDAGSSQAKETLRHVRCEDRNSLNPRFERTRPDGTVVESRTNPIADGGFVRTITDITERRRTEAKLIQLARHDSLTVLANRAVFRDELEQSLKARRNDEMCAVHCIDLDRFKNVNDTLGHPVGDRLLQQVANRLRKSVRLDDVVARLGGDEFAIIQRGVITEADSSSLAQRIVQRLGEPFEIDGNSIVVGASVGIGLAPSHGKGADELLRNADMALYSAKSKGRSRFEFFADSMRAVVEARRVIEVDLRAAIIDKEFEIHYQPLLNSKTEVITGFEALLRWQHPKKGMIPPLDFVPIAEDLRLITHIGAWSIEEACRRAAHWPSDLKVAVNLSPVQLESGGLVEVVTKAIEKTGLAPSRLELEITESALLQNNEITLATLHALRQLGVTIAMDDFGTGYSALSYLLQFPFDKIKIDRTFVKDLGRTNGSQQIVRAIVDLAHNLGMTTTAEGVEKPEQLAALTALQCDECQGYLFSPPRPTSEVSALIERFQPGKQAA